MSTNGQLKLTLPISGATEERYKPFGSLITR